MHDGARWYHASVDDLRVMLSLRVHKEFRDGWVLTPTEQTARRLRPAPPIDLRRIPQGVRVPPEWLGGAPEEDLRDEPPQEIPPREPPATQAAK
jgi:hypothetical protein